MDENGQKGNLSVSLSHFLRLELSEQVKAVCKEGDAESRDDTRRKRRRLDCAHWEVKQY